MTLGEASSTKIVWDMASSTEAATKKERSFQKVKGVTRGFLRKGRVVVRDSRQGKWAVLHSKVLRVSGTSGVRRVVDERHTFTLSSDTALEASCT